MAYNEDSSASGHDEPWIQWFCGLKGHEVFCEVERSYIEDGFNLYGLRACVSNFSDCLDMILDRIGPDDSDDSHLTQNACTLYGLIHARYIITAHGLDSMYNKYAGKEFGTCPLVQCAGQPVLPVGLKDELGTDTVKIYCPKCKCVYHPPPVRSRQYGSAGAVGGSGVDGAYFGTTFPHLFLMTFSNLVPDPLPTDSAYIPRVFGFRVHPSARQRNAPPSSSASPLGVAAGVSSSRLADAEITGAVREENHRSSRGNGVATGEAATPQNTPSGSGGGKLPLDVMDGGTKEARSSQGRKSEDDSGRSNQKRKTDLATGGDVTGKRESDNGVLENSVKKRKR